MPSTVNDVEKAAWCYALGIQNEIGVTLVMALEAAGVAAQSPFLSSVSQQICKTLDGGGHVGDVLKQHPNIFGTDFIALARDSQGNRELGRGLMTKALNHYPRHGDLREHLFGKSPGLFEVLTSLKERIDQGQNPSLALGQIRVDTDSGWLARKLVPLIDHMEGGMDLADALQLQPDFNRQFVTHILRVGVAKNSLSSVIEELTKPLLASAPR